MKTQKFPQFDSYACVGDTIQWQKEGFTITARIEFDQDTKITDFRCYAPIKVKHWKNDEWFFCGVVLSVSKGDVLLSRHAASLWGIACNYNKTSNRHLADVAQELEREAIESAKKRVAHMLEVLA